jgi:hypothetical protein
VATAAEETAITSPGFICALLAGQSHCISAASLYFIHAPLVAEIAKDMSSLLLGPTKQSEKPLAFHPLLRGSRTAPSATRDASTTFWAATDAAVFLSSLPGDITVPAAIGDD